VANPFGVYLEQISTTHESNRAWEFTRAWRDGRLLGRVVDRTMYAADGTTPPEAFEFEAQIWDGRAYDQEGMVYRSFLDALEFLT
jgi:hypothetical protein